MDLQWLLPLMTRGGKMLNIFKKVFEFFFQKVEHISTFLSHKIITHLIFSVTGTQEKSHHTLLNVICNNTPLG
jgi:hypothetical protein